MSLFSFKCRFFSEVEAALCFGAKKISNSSASDVPVLLLVSYEIFSISSAAVKRSEQTDTGLDTETHGLTGCRNVTGRLSKAKS
jgi:hypothetical protein